MRESARRFKLFRMNAELGELASALRERLTIIDDEESRQNPDRHVARLRDVSERIERLEQQLAAELDPQLRHYLQRRSYSKALEHLEAL